MVDPHADLVDEYVRIAEGQGIPIVAVLETHVQADHVSGARGWSSEQARPRTSPRAPAWTSTTSRSPTATVELGNTELQAIATPGHAAAHHAYLVTDHTQGDEPWFVLTGDALLVGDAGGPTCTRTAMRPSTRWRGRSTAITERLLSLPDHLLVYPATTRARSAAAACRATRRRRSASSAATAMRSSSTRRTRSRRRSSRTFLAPPQQAEIVAANRAGRSPPPAVTSPGVRSGSARTPRSSRCWSLSTRSSSAMVGLEALDPAADRRSGLRPRVERRGALVHRRVRPRQGVHEPGRGRLRRAGIGKRRL